MLLSCFSQRFGKKISIGTMIYAGQKRFIYFHLKRANPSGGVIKEIWQMARISDNLLGMTVVICHLPYGNMATFFFR